MKNLITAVLLGLSLLFFAACWSSETEGEVANNTEQQSIDKQEETRLKIQKVEDEAAIPKFEINEKFDALAEEKEWPKMKKFIKKQIYLGKDVDLRDKSGKTPLFYAIKNYDLPLIKKLIKGKADINVQSLKEGTPIFSAIDLLWGKDEMHNNYERSMDILNYMLSKKPDLEKRMFNDKLTACVACPEGITPLHYAVYTGSEVVVKKLARQKADVNAVNKQGHTPLHFAAIFGNIPVMEALIRRKADVNAHDKVGMTPLHHTVKWGKVEATQLLIKKRAHLIAKDQRGRTPLHFMFDNYSSANEFQKLAILQMLMDSKANVYVRDKTNISFMNIAQKMHKNLKGTEMAHYIKKKVFIQKPTKRQVSYIVYDTKGKANYIYEDVAEEDQNDSEWITSSSNSKEETHQFDPTKAVISTSSSSSTTTTTRKDVTGTKGRGYGISDSYSVDRQGNKKYDDGSTYRASTPSTSSGVQYGISSETYKKVTPGVYTSSSSTPSSSSSSYGISSSTSSSRAIQPSKPSVNYGISSETYKGGSSGSYSSSSSYSSGSTYRSSSSSTYSSPSPSSSGIKYGISEGSNSMSRSSYSSGGSSSSSSVIRSSSPTIIRSSTTTPRTTSSPSPSISPTYNKPAQIFDTDDGYLDDEPVYDEEFEDTGNDR